MASYESIATMHRAFSSVHVSNQAMAKRRYKRHSYVRCVCKRTRPKSFTISRVHTRSASTAGRCTSRFRSRRESPLRFVVWPPIVIFMYQKISCSIWYRVQMFVISISSLLFKTTSNRIPSCVSVPARIVR